MFFYLCLTSRVLRLFQLFVRRTLIDQVDNAHVWNTCVCLQTNLAGTAVRVAHLNVIGLDLRTQLAKAIFIQLRERKASVASKATTAHALRQEDIRRTHLGEIDEIVCHTHLPRRTGDVKGERTVYRMEVETIHQIGHDKFCWLVQLHLLHHFTHAV